MSPRGRALGSPGIAGWSGRKHWWPRARGGSVKGDWTIRVCELDRGEYIEIYDDHVNKEVRPVADDLLDAIHRNAGVPDAFNRALRRLQPTMPFVGLSYDALRHLVPAKDLAAWNLAWPDFHEVGRIQPRRRRRRP
jgi:hypothetical protein